MSVFSISDSDEVSRRLASAAAVRDCSTRLVRAPMSAWTLMIRLASMSRTATAFEIPAESPARRAVARAAR
jgi:hypothetical protein